MIETFVALLFAHALADFIFQTNWMVAQKRSAHVLLMHGIIVLAMSQATTGYFGWEIFVLALAHVLIDTFKTHALPDTLGTFCADQLAHVATLIATAMLAPTLFDAGIWNDFAALPALMAFATGLIITTRAGGIAVAYLVAPWSGVDLPKGLNNGGQLIGLLERGLIFLLVMVGQPAGIGFLIAAKSVLRFDTTSKDQRAGEYVIIGTLASFSWALVASYLTLVGLNHIGPLGLLPKTP
jgi:hypothetical protein